MNYQGSFRKLVVWQSAKKLALEIYRLTQKFPKTEMYGLISDMRRASVSHMANIAEGNQRNGRADKLHFFNMSLSSLVELDSHSELAFELKYISQKDYEKLLEMINKAGYLMSRLIESYKNPNNLKNLNFPNNPNKKGFSLVEMLIVVAIIAILAVSATAGLGLLGDILKVRQVTGIMGDIIKQEDLKVLRGDFEKATIYFLPYYIVIEETPKELNLTLGIKKDPSCPEGYKIDYGNDANLIQKDGEGETLDAKVVKTGDSDCVEFKTSEETEWNFQMIEGAKFSQNIRFVHFNVQRDNLTNPIYVSLGVDSKIEITAPYGKKKVYKIDDEDQYKLLDDPSAPNYHVSITVTNQNENSSDTLILQ